VEREARRHASSGYRRLLLVAVILIMATGCVTPKRTNLVIPRRCLKVDEQSFTRPCQERVDGKLVCDGVVVTATCLKVVQ